MVLKVLIDKNLIDEITIGIIYSMSKTGSNLPGHYFPIFKNNDIFYAFIYLYPGNGGIIANKSINTIINNIGDFYIEEFKKEEMYKNAAYFKKFYLSQNDVFFLYKLVSKIKEINNMSRDDIVKQLKSYPKVTKGFLRKMENNKSQLPDYAHDPDFVENYDKMFNRVSNAVYEKLKDQFITEY